MYKILTQTGDLNFNLSVVKVVGEKRLFEPDNLEYLVVNEDGKEFYVGSNRIFDTPEEAKLGLIDKATENYDQAMAQIEDQKLEVEAKLTALV